MPGMAAAVTARSKARTLSFSAGSMVVPNSTTSADSPAERKRGVAAIRGSSPKRHMLIGQPVDEHGDEQKDAEADAINCEWPGGEAFEDSQQAPDGDEGGNRSDDEADGKDRPAMGVEMRLVQFVEFLEPRGGDRRNAEQEGKARGLGPLEVAEQSRGECRAGARHARNQRAALRQAD